MIESASILGSGFIGLIAASAEGLKRKRLFRKKWSPGNIRSENEALV